MDRRFTKIFAIVIVVLKLYFIFHLFYPLVKNERIPIKLGLDLRYGIHIMLEMYDPSKKILTDTEMRQIIGILEKRLNPTGTYEIVIQQAGNNRVIIEIPEITDTAEALERVTKVGKLEFKVDEYDPNTGILKKKTVLTGDRIIRATVEYDPNTHYPHVAFTLDAEGAKIFEQVTRDYLQKPIYIYFDNKEISAPIVQSVIAGGSGIITLGAKDKEEALKEARELAIYLNAGKLDYPPKVLEAYTIGPTLGEKHLKKSLEAGFIALVTVGIFMIFFYRIPGLVAVFALIFYGLLFVWIISISNTVLTLGSIAGIILSIGMAVDANILIFERFKEELRSGKPTNTSLDLAFARSFDTILDSHLTTILAALVLIIFGTPTIQGFAFALLWGNVVSFFTAIYVTKTIIYLLFYINPKIVELK
ncbi:MAG: protein translocase subunit SecD [Candidatus Calescibacterium sp.]|nr:protein translocase subunit SecD [Candidatus Calescibacterium sp.]MCX7971651.1 protein translocase subunit SecD [bacterium]MDW8195257.1 protein translocase subunit SecD [Candidatus Calescibacterium sp.]